MMPAAAWTHLIGSTDGRSPARGSGLDGRPRWEPRGRRLAPRAAALPDVALTIRRATGADRAALTDLARLDSARPLDGDVLLALLDGQPVAALELDGLRSVADPFSPTEEALAMLRQPARQLRREAASPHVGRARPHLRAPARTFAGR